MTEHTYKTEGSDCKPYRMLAMCSCGWRGEVRLLDGQEAHGKAKAEWLAHKHLVDETARREKAEVENVELRLDIMELREKIQTLEESKRETG